jgi:hypothetical protein
VVLVELVEVFLRAVDVVLVDLALREAARGRRSGRSRMHRNALTGSSWYRAAAEER